MPPKKRKAGPSVAAQKRLRVNSSSPTDNDNGAVEVSASGRPKRSTAGDPSYDQTRRRRSRSSSKVVAESTPPAKRGPGRPRTSGLPIRAPATANKETTKTTLAAKPKERLNNSAAKTLQATKSVIKKGQNKPSTTSPYVLVEDSTGAIVEEEDWEEEDDDDEPSSADDGNGQQFWLMKAEPESRIENGQDVKFSIDDLLAKTEPEAWDGVRNFVARNNMRAMREGDLAFFYHSNCAVPGIAGVMQIVREHSIDESAFDPSHPYYDPKSKDRSKPKWEVVHVKGLRKFHQLVTLKELKSHMGPGEPLENMQTLKQSRLSVTKVSIPEWNHVFIMSGEAPFVEDLVGCRRDKRERGW